MKRWPLLAAFLLLLPPGLLTGPERPAEKFPAELVKFVQVGKEPVFRSAEKGQWDAKIRERGWILRDGGIWKIWYTGYDCTDEGLRMLGYATSPDGIRW